MGGVYATSPIEQGKLQMSFAGPTFLSFPQAVGAGAGSGGGIAKVGGGHDSGQKWGAYFGSLNDRFGTNWIVNYSAPQTQQQ